MNRSRFGKLISLVTVLTVAVSSFITDVSAQALGLTEEQQKEFNRLRLSVEVAGVSTGGTVASTWRKWQAHRGFNERLSEKDFFKLTGYEKEASQAGRYSRTTKIIYGVGSLVAIGGLAQATKGLSNERGDPQPVRTGLAVFSIGSGIITYGILRSLSNWAPYATVQGITEEYNKKLMVQIQKKF